MSFLTLFYDNLLNFVVENLQIPRLSLKTAIQEFNLLNFRSSFLKIENNDQLKSDPSYS